MCWTDETMMQASVEKATRTELKHEITRLRTVIRSMERTNHFDQLTGLPNRSYFLERASAEFQRSRRYDHQLSIVALTVQGYNTISQQHGQEGADAAISGLGQVCETASRLGIDLVGRVGESQLAVLLPETSLAGALKFMKRLRSIISETPIHTGTGYARLGVLSSIDTVHHDDLSIMQTLDRLQQSFQH